MADATEDPATSGDPPLDTEGSTPDGPDAQVESDVVPTDDGGALAAAGANPFRQNRLLTPERVGPLSQTADALRGRLAEELSRWVNEVRIETRPLEQVDLATLAADGSDLAVVKARDHLAYGLVTTELSLAIPAVAVLCGGQPDEMAEARPLSKIEVSVFDLVLESALRLAAESFDAGPCEIAYHVIAAAALPTPSDEPAIAVPFHVKVGPAEGLLTFVLTASHLQTHVEALDQRIAGRQAARGRGPNELVARALVPVPVELIVGFEPMAVPAGQLVGLEVGDVIRTGKSVSQNLVARIGDESLYQVRAAQRGQRLVAEILGPVSSRKDTA